MHWQRGLFCGVLNKNKSKQEIRKGALKLQKNIISAKKAKARMRRGSSLLSLTSTTVHGDSNCGGDSVGEEATRDAKPLISPLRVVSNRDPDPDPDPDTVQTHAGSISSGVRRRCARRRERISSNYADGISAHESVNCDDNGDNGDNEGTRVSPSFSFANEQDITTTMPSSSEYNAAKDMAPELSTVLFVCLSISRVYFTLVMHGE